MLDQEPLQRVAIPCRQHRACHRQQGAIAVMAAGCLLLMLAVCGIALDIAQVYNRNMELQSLADAAALAAASQLDGTQQGVSNALDKARDVVEEGSKTLRVKYGATKVNWNDAAISFGRSAATDAEWSDAASAAQAAAGMLYARVDTRPLGDGYGLVSTVFMHVLAPQSGNAVLSARSVAGRSSVNVTPLAVCAMSPTDREGRSNPANGSTPANVELVEFGFRRGVSYDLMQLNSNGTTPAHFIVDPVTPPGVLGSAAHVTTSAVAPFVCSGTMAVGELTSGNVTVVRNFPLDELHGALNSRFGDYSSGLCTANGAPPDFNVRPYQYSSGVSWMSTPRSGQAAQSFSGNGKLQTIADPSPPPVAATAAAYGPLWAYARAVPFSAYRAGVPEPASGYTPFATNTWPALYGPGKPVASGYPSGSGTPYTSYGGSFFMAAPMASRPGVRQRRVLNVLLLRCPVVGAGLGQATVAGIGRFFMTVPATTTTLVAEFAGLASESVLGRHVELYR
ncbi:pilus assembly protein TadG-related protein [Massilia sp. H6]|uniref:pilus assembly protein TadG-related protein n=1 Tax=Massilia sp. H6 TaxID=2970464 RepID=UPI00216A4287|nr:pilus assembly protein TadG-related protein [Massilia sp. H6]UVW26844.1 pilus assembly protein TadG-related protein [Massilia sp. H6]